MGTRACIIWRAIHEDGQETQVVTYKRFDGHYDRVKGEIQKFYEFIKLDKNYGLKDSEFLASEFIKFQPDYQITREWWLYDNFYFITVKCLNESFDWSVSVFNWNEADSYYFGIRKE